MHRVNHRESESDRIELRRHGWRVTTFARFFSPASGLGSDWGWGLNGADNGEGSSTSPDSEPEYGYKTMQGTGNWSEGGATRNGASSNNWKAVGKSGGGKGEKSGTRKLDPNKVRYSSSLRRRRRSLLTSDRPSSIKVVDLFAEFCLVTATDNILFFRFVSRTYLRSSNVG